MVKHLLLIRKRPLNVKRKTQMSFNTNKPHVGLTSKHGNAILNVILEPKTRQTSNRKQKMKQTEQSLDSRFSDKLFTFCEKTQIPFEYMASKHNKFEIKVAILTSMEKIGAFPEPAIRNGKHK